MAQDTKKGATPPKTLKVVQPGPELTGSTATIKRKAKRITLGKKQDIQKGTPQSLKDLLIANSIVSSDARALKTTRQKHGLSIKSVNAAFTGTFNTFHKRNNLSQLISYSDQTLTYYSGPHRVARLKNLQLTSSKTRAKLGANKLPAIMPVQLIDDNTTQLLVWRHVKNQRGDTLYKITLYKIFGRYFGKAFDHTVGVKLAGKNKIMPTANYSFVKGKNHIDLHLTPVDKKGNVLTNATQVLTYHKWEGNYRVPSPVPTSPKQLRSAMKQ